MKWFNSYLSERKQQCWVNGHLSSPKTIKCGVPQGSILGPLLFLIYINDLPNCLKHSNPRMFADDTNITAISKSITKYCDIVWDTIGVTLATRLQKLNNRTGRTISQLGYEVRSSDIRSQLGWTTLEETFKS